MLFNLKLWINRQRLRAALRREETARNAVTAERQNLVNLEIEIERLKFEAMTCKFSQRV